MQLFLDAATETNQHLPFAATMPAAMLPILDRPLIARVLEPAVREGVSRFVIGLHHFPEQIERYLGDGSRWGAAFSYVLLPHSLGNAGALRWSRRLLDGPCVIMPASSLVDVSVAALVAHHQRNENTLTIAAHATATGDVLFVDEAGNLTTESSQTRRVSATGVYVVEPAALDRVPRRTDFDIYDDLLPALRDADEPIGVALFDGYWNPLRTTRDFQEAQEAYLRSAERADAEDRAARRLPRYPDVRATRYAKGIWVGRSNAIHPAARLKAPVYVGEHCQIAADVELGPNAFIGSNVVLSEGATIQKSTVFDHSYVGQLVNVSGRIARGATLVDVASGSAVEVPDDFLMTTVAPTTVGRRLRRRAEAFLALQMLFLSLPLLAPVLIVTFLTTGRLFTREPRVVRMDGNAADGRRHTIRLLRCYTRRPSGSFIGLGRWVEKWQLHRLPELWNVVRGELRLVGLRPLRPRASKAMDEHWQNARHGEEAGFTGLWYVTNEDGAGRDALLAADAYYAATHEWTDDIKLLLRTPGAWARQVRSAEEDRAKY